ncbi:MAG: hypothetical protein U0235_32815 [Polyangiaceae bacterium]
MQPASGSPANLAVYLAFCQPGDTIMGLGLPSAATSPRPQRLDHRQVLQGRLWRPQRGLPNRHG